MTTEQFLTHPVPMWLFFAFVFLDGFWKVAKDSAIQELKRKVEKV